MKNKEEKEIQNICLIKWVSPEIQELILLNTEGGGTGGEDGGAGYATLSV